MFHRVTKSGIVILLFILPIILILGLKYSGNLNLTSNLDLGNIALRGPCNTIKRDIIQGNQVTRSAARTLEYSLTHNGITASSANMYINRKNYTHNLKPNYYLDHGVGDLRYQLATYYVAGELARRYHARYLIDMGCGSGVKLSSYRNEFHLIGIDYKTNVKNAKRDFPFMELIEANLEQDGDCSVTISPHILMQAVVVSADVIEHLVNPLPCYIKLLKVSGHFQFEQLCNTY